jgi:hypothetical protein
MLHLTVQSCAALIKMLTSIEYPSTIGNLPNKSLTVSKMFLYVTGIHLLAQL